MASQFTGNSLAWIVINKNIIISRWPVDFPHKSQWYVKLFHAMTPWCLMPVYILKPGAFNKVLHYTPLCNHGYIADFHARPGDEMTKSYTLLNYTHCSENSRVTETLMSLRVNCFNMNTEYTLSKLLQTGLKKQTAQYHFLINVQASTTHRSPCSSQKRMNCFPHKVR